MKYLIFDETGELFDVLEFNSIDEINNYMNLNPLHAVQLATEEIDDIDSEDDLDD